MGHVATFQVPHDGVRGQTSRLHEMNRNLIVARGPQTFLLTLVWRHASICGHVVSVLKPPNHFIASSPGENNTSNHEDRFLRDGTPWKFEVPTQCQEGTAAQRCNGLYFNVQRTKMRRKNEILIVPKWTSWSCYSVQWILTVSVHHIPFETTKQKFVTFIRRSELCVANPIFRPQPTKNVVSPTDPSMVCLFSMV